MKQRTIIKFEGGPRAGVELAKTRPARVSTYIDENADTVSVALGDRIVSARTDGAVYRKSSIDIAPDLTRTITYVYFTTSEGN